MTQFDVEIGKLMAQFENVQQRIDELKKGMDTTNKQLQNWRKDFDCFTGEIMEKMERKFVLRSELAPIKAILSVIAAATVSAICLNLSDLIFSKLL